MPSNNTIPRTQIVEIIFGGKNSMINQKVLRNQSYKKLFQLNLRWIYVDAFYDHVPETNYYLVEGRF